MSDAPNRTAPTFLVAAERSGIETLRVMMAQHSRIAIAPDLEFLVDAISPDGRFMKREAFLRSVEFNERFKQLGLTIPEGAPFADIAHALLDQVSAAKPGASVVGMTLRHHFDRVLWLWPDARFIHLVRDGRGVAFANVQARRAGNLWHGIADWVEAEQLWDRMSHKLPVERQHTIRYEVLANEPEHELRRLCDFLRLPFQPAMIEPAAGLAADMTASWRRLDVRVVSTAEHRAARWLLQNGYFLSGTVRAPSTVRRWVLNLQNRLVIANRRRELLGTGLWLKGAIAGKLGSRKAKARIQRRQREILVRGKD